QPISSTLDEWPYIDPGFSRYSMDAALDLPADPKNPAAEYPTKGTDATPGGKAGEGGPAGSLHSLGADLTAFAQMNGGPAADKHPAYPGGSTGQPSVFVSFTSASCVTSFRFSCQNGPIYFLPDGYYMEGCDGSTDTRLFLGDPKMLYAGAAASAPSP